MKKIRKENQQKSVQVVYISTEPVKGWIYHNDQRCLNKEIVFFLSWMSNFIFTRSLSAPITVLNFHITTCWCRVQSGFLTWRAPRRASGSALAAHTEALTMASRGKRWFAVTRSQSALWIVNITPSARINTPAGVYSFVTVKLWKIHNSC